MACSCLEMLASRPLGCVSKEQSEEADQPTWSAMSLVILVLLPPMRRLTKMR